MLQRIVALLAGLCVALAWSEAATARQKRLALVIGNATYKPIGTDLVRAAEDARTVAAILTRHGFTSSGETVVKPLIDANKANMVQQIDNFLAEIDPGDVAVFFFAGHGIQSDRENFLIPSGISKLDLHLDDEAVHRQLKRDAYSFKKMMDEFQEKSEKFRKAGKAEISGIFILDACRTFAIQGAGNQRFFDLQRSGLVPMAPVGGTFVMYSADVGQAALESLGDRDRDPNGVYTRELKVLLEHPDVDLVDIAKELKARVYDLSKTAEKQVLPQTPVYYDGFIYRTSITGQVNARRLGDSESRARVALDLKTERMLVAATATAGGPTVRSLSAINTIIDCDGCPELVIVRGQPFKIGSPAAERGHAAHEAQADIALMHQYAIGKHEVTWGDWLACISWKGQEKCEELHDTGYHWSEKPDDAKGLPAGVAVAHGGDDAKIPDHRRPAVKVSWYQAQQFIRFLSAKTGKRYRLPTEAEWEYAARGGSSGPYSFVSDPKTTFDALSRELCHHGNGADRRMRMWLWPGNDHCDDGFGRIPAPVGSYRPNAFGLYDVHGNVWEWVNDCWRERHVASDGKPAASDGSEARCDRTVRGGSWQSEPNAMRSASRSRFAPNHSRRTLGFRVVRDVEQAPEAARAQ